MKVRATQMCFVEGSRYRIGAVFAIRDEPTREVEEGDGEWAHRIAIDGRIPVDFVTGMIPAVEPAPVDAVLSEEDEANNIVRSLKGDAAGPRKTIAQRRAATDLKMDVI